MTPQEKLIDELFQKYGEWLEHYDVDFLIGVLINMVLKEREINDNNKRRIGNVSSTNSAE